MCVGRMLLRWWEQVLTDEGGDGVDVREEVSGPAGAPGDVPGSDCSPLCPAQSPQQRFGSLAGGHADQQPRPPASNNNKLSVTKLKL